MPKVAFTNEMTYSFAILSKIEIGNDLPNIKYSNDLEHTNETKEVINTLWLIL